MKIMINWKWTINTAFSENNGWRECIEFYVACVRNQGIINGLWHSGDTLVIESLRIFDTENCHIEHENKFAFENINEILAKLYKQEKVGN